jgi:hypothetical protein
MDRMLMVERAILLDLEATGSIFLVLFRGVILSLALGTLQLDIDAH